MGLASLVLSFFAGLLFLAYLWSVLRWAQLEQTGRAPFHDSEPALAAGGFFLMAMAFLTGLVALGLGVAGAIQRERKKAFAFLGIACSVLALAMLNTELGFAELTSAITGITDPGPNVEVHVVSPGSE